ncbi:MAG: hypothetical protein WBF66_02140 [Dehalococcoidia bacterium]
MQELEGELRTLDEMRLRLQARFELAAREREVLTELGRLIEERMSLDEAEEGTDWGALSERLAGPRGLQEAVAVRNAVAHGLRPPTRMTMAEAAYAALSQLDRAAHYTEILDFMRESRMPVGAQLRGPTLITAMLRDDRFEKVDEPGVRGIYALAEWDAEKKRFDRLTWDLKNLEMEFAQEQRRVQRFRERVGHWEGLMTAIARGEVEEATAAMADELPPAERSRILRASPKELRKDVSRRCENTQRFLEIAERGLSELARQREGLRRRIAEASSGGDGEEKGGQR